MGESDYFIVEFSQPETNDYHRVSTAIDHINVKSWATDGYFRLTFGGKVTEDISSNVTAEGLEAILESLHNYQLNVQVTKSADIWAIEFLTMLNVWQSRPPSGGDTDLRLGLVKPSHGSDDFFNELYISRPANRGVYPVSFTLWHTGTYDVRISHNGVDIAGSPTTIFVSNAPVDPTASLTTGSGLVGGEAGVPIEVFVQAKDSRQTEIQNLVSNAFVTDYTFEIQSITFASGTFQLTFRGQSTGDVVCGHQHLH